MSGRSPNFVPSPRFSNGTPSRNQQYPHRQPLYLPPNSPFMSPRSHRTPSPRGRPSGDGTDFIPIGFSSPVNRARQQWNRGSHSNSSSYSSYSTSSSPSSFNSSHGYSPYNRNSSRGRFRGKNNFNSGSGSPPIHLYCDKEALEDPWAELAERLEKKQGQTLGRTETDKERVKSGSSGSEVSDNDDDS